jgi:uncharacterized membrane protein YhaH (DUF805 family)
MSQYAEDSSLSAAGRFGRMTYIAWNCLLLLVIMAIIVVFSAVFPNLIMDMQTGSYGIGVIFIGLLYLVLFYFTIIFTIRRLHDRNHTGWLSLLMLVPAANIVLALYLTFAAGDARPNSYGAPRETRGWENILAWIYIVLLVVGLFAGIIMGISG